MTWFESALRVAQATAAQQMYKNSTQIYDSTTVFSTNNLHVGGAPDPERTRLSYQY